MVSCRQIKDVLQAVDMESYTFVKHDPNKFKEYARFLSEVYTHTDKFSADYIKWEYLENPRGPAIGYDAHHKNKLVAHYVTQPMAAYLNGKIRKGLLSINTATHPEHRNKELFTRLVRMTCSYARDLGYEFIYGVANSNSTHGFTNKLGFQFVAPLKAKIGVGSIHFGSQNHEFHRIWKEADLKWRLDNPNGNYFGYRNSLFCRTDKYGLDALLCVADKDVLNYEKGSYPSKRPRPLRLFVGIDNSINWNRHLYLNVPERYKSSPLNLIFKDLSGDDLTLKPENVKLRLIDFDGF